MQLRNSVRLIRCWHIHTEAAQYWHCRMGLDSSRLFGVVVATTGVLAVLTASQGLEQRLDANVKEARILLVGRHGCRGYVATVTDNRGGGAGRHN